MELEMRDLTEYFKSVEVICDMEILTTEDKERFINEIVKEMTDEEKRIVRVLYSPLYEEFRIGGDYDKAMNFTEEMLALQESGAEIFVAMPKGSDRMVYKAVSDRGEILAMYALTRGAHLALEVMGFTQETI